MAFFSKYSIAIQWVRNHKYLCVTIVFLLIVVLFDDNSLIKHFENGSRISELESEIAAMERDSIRIEQLNAMIGPEGDTEEIERICRSVHGMHTENEDVFIIED